MLSLRGVVYHNLRWRLGNLPSGLVALTLVVFVVALTLVVYILVAQDGIVYSRCA